jgi:probable DNA metabolism protein
MAETVEIALAEGADEAGFRRAVRRLIAASIAPEHVHWTTGMPSLFGAAPPDDAPPVPLPREAADLVRLVLCHRDPERHALLYRLIWRLSHGERRLLSNPADPLVHRLNRLAKAVRRDLHKMHAFLRFRRTVDEVGRDHFVAWFEPDHFILEATAQFFVDRFRSFTWSILTPIGSLHWNGERLACGPPARRQDAPAADAFEAGWRGYYEAAFNPARLNMRATMAEMPRKYWRNLPEAQAIPDLIRTAPARVEAMIEREAAMPAKRDPEKAVAAMARQEPASLEDLNRIIAASEPLVPGATRAVLGEGPIGAPWAFVGEQPGDREDREGRPFVGPAGQLLDRAMEEAGIDRSRVYVTNAVKHFKFVLRGKRRIHAKPTLGEIKHYRWWLMRELDFVAPRVVVALGATAVTALAGRPMPLLANRGPATFDNRRGYITVHPSWLLRLPDAAAQKEAWSRFVEDLRAIRALAA